MYDNPYGLKKQEMEFCYKYLELDEPTPTQAAKDVGYKNPSRSGEKLMGNPNVIKTLNKLMDEREKRTTVTMDRTVLELAKIGYFNPDDIFKNITAKKITLKDYKKLPRHVKAAIASVKITKTGIDIRFHSKTDALDKLMRHHGAYLDKLTVGVTDEPLNTQGTMTTEIKDVLNATYKQKGG